MEGSLRGLLFEKMTLKLTPRGDSHRGRREWKAGVGGWGRASQAETRAHSKALRWGKTLWYVGGTKRMLASFQLWSLCTEARLIFKPTLLESGESKFVLFPARHASRACSLLDVCVSVEKSKWITCQDWGGWGLAGRMWSVCTFCLFLKFTSLQIHA